MNTKDSSNVHVWHNIAQEYLAGHINFNWINTTMSTPIMSTPKVSMYQNVTKCVLGVFVYELR